MVNLCTSHTFLTNLYPKKPFGPSPRKFNFILFQSKQENAF